MISPLIANDNFVDAQAIAYDGLFFDQLDNNDGATRENLEPLHGATNPGSLANASRWYSVTVTESQRIEVLIDYEGAGASGLDAVVAVYTGDDVANLTEISRYADIQVPAHSARLSEPFTRFARLNFDAVPGTTYHIAVDGEGNRGPYRLVLQPSRDPHNPTAELVAPGSDWRTLIARDENIPVDPLTIDSDFFVKWHDPANLDALGFTAPSPTPAGYGVIDALLGDHELGTGLWNPLNSDAPPSGSRNCAYLRTSFTPGSQITGLGFEGLFDDGAIIYVNGNEVARVNIDEAADALSWQTTALSTTLPDGAGDTEKVVQYATAESVNLPAGVPVEIAVSLHNQGPGSSDMAFNMRIWALGGGGVVEPYEPPFLATITPSSLPGRYDITWPSKNGEIYQIQSSSSIESDDWTDVFPSDIDPSGTGTNTSNIPGSGSRTFYRVIIR
ncbi:hypothetical protein N9230_04575 [Akkermansiaceae bacterium]|nr:hypothetical protein [Akkermansiaceae bacterium]